MKKMLFAAFPVLAALLLIPSADPLPIGSSLPNADVKMKDISGKEISFKDAMKKNGLLVMFSCNTCPIVQKYEARTMESCKLAMSKDIGVILLNPNEAYRQKGDSYEDMKSYASRLGYNFAYVLDENSKMADVFGATRTPECFLFDKNGKLVYHGAIDDDANAANASDPFLHKAISNMINGGKIDPDKTKSIGCTIKRN